MKTSVSAVLGLVFWALSIAAHACGPFEREYLARDYFMFRACGDNMTGEGTIDASFENRSLKENCKAWAALTSNGINHKDIVRVVYQWNQSEIQELSRAARGKAKDYETDNEFAAWIVEHKDTEIADFLLLAKRSETVRSAMSSPWYYAVEGDEPSLELLKIAEEARSYRGKRLRDRYALQAMRGLFYCRQYDDCLNYWKKARSWFKDGAIKRLAQSYVAGSMYHVGEKDEAVKLYLAIGNLYEAHKCSSSKSDFNRWLMEVQPDNDLLIRQLQAEIHGIERWQGVYWRSVGENGREKYEKLFPSVRQIIADNHCRNMAQWYYAGAFIADKLDLEQEAFGYIEQAQNAHPKGDLAASIRVLDFYMTVKYAKEYTVELENRVFAELRWLDGMIVSKLDKRTQKSIGEEGFGNHVCGYSQFYWNDMMRKIVISELVPLCMKSKYQTRALQYLNMADNRIFKLVSDVTVERWIPDDNGYGYRQLPDTLMTMDGYRSYVAHHNAYDYCNDYFLNLDSIGVTYVKRLCERQQHPLSPLDKFLNERSYIDSMYLYDIIGTQLIAARKFDEAIGYLERVDADFNKSRNVYLHCNVDPFTLKKTKPDTHYRLHYAQEMHRLEQRLETCTDPNEKAKLMLKYSRGLMSSIGIDCWPLTTFYWGSFYCFPFYSRYQRSMIDGTAALAQQMKDDAFALFTDEEAAAKAYYDWSMYKTAVTKFPQSKTADFIRGHCDELRDYVVRPETYPKKERELWMEKMGEKD